MAVSDTPPPPNDNEGVNADPPRTATFRQTAAAVLWSLFGVRKRRESEKDVRLNPVHVVTMALVAGSLFVLTLMLIVRVVVRNL